MKKLKSKLLILYSIYLLVLVAVIFLGTFVERSDSDPIIGFIILISFVLATYGLFSKDSDHK